MTEVKTVRSEAPPFVSSEVPLYYQLGTILREQILSGAYGPGDQLPTEAELVADYGVSRITVRQALKALEDEKLIRREAGRGTFVTGSSLLPDPLHQAGSLDELTSLGPAKAVRLLDLRPVAATAKDAEAFAIPIGSPVMLCARLHLHRDQLYSYVINRLPKEVADRLSDQDWESGCLLLSLEERIGLRLGEADQTLSAALASASMARLLETRVGMPLLSVDRVMRTEGGRGVARVHTLYRCDVFALRLDLARGGTEALSPGSWILKGAPQPVT